MKNSTLLLLFLCCAATLKAQDINPYASIGKEGKIVTLSNGRYQEVQIDDSLQRVGAAIMNMNTGKIYKLLDDDSLNSSVSVDPTIVSRWYSVDPKATKYPAISPYASFSNNPILIVDPDGGENIVYVMLSPTAKTQLKTSQVNDIISNAQNIYTNTLGLNVKVVLYDDKNYGWGIPGSFSVNNLDKSDAVAYIGTAAENANFAQSQGASSSFVNEVASASGGQAETSQLPGNIVTVDLDQSKVAAVASNATVDQMMGFTIAHGTGHNAGIEHPQTNLSLSLNIPPYLIPDFSIMSNGGFVSRQTQAPYADVPERKGYTSLMDWAKPENNKSLFPAFHAKFNGASPSDNYNKNLFKSKPSPDKTQPQTTKTY